MASTSESQRKAAQAEVQGNISDLLGKLEAARSSLQKKITDNQASQSENIASLRILKNTAKSTLSQLDNIYSDEYRALEGNARVLADQKTTNKLLKHQINEAQKELEVLKDNRLNKERLVKLGDYEHDRFRSHKHILKIVTYGALAILLILMAMTNIPFFPSSVGVFGIFLILCVVIYSILSRVYDNFRRRSHNWNKFNYSRYSKNEPIRRTTDDNKSEGDDLNSKCEARGFTLDPAAAVNLTFLAPSENFTNLINTETLSNTVEPSNTLDYEKYPALF